jgi:hypothetical protein
MAVDRSALMQVNDAIGVDWHVISGRFDAASYR